MFLLSFLSGEDCWGFEFADFQGSLQLRTSSHLRERDKMLLRAIGPRPRRKMFPAVFVGRGMVGVHLSLPLARQRAARI